MARPPESTRTSLRQRLTARARKRWPQLDGITVRWHGEFAYVAGQLPGGTTLPLMRLRYAGSATTWGFAIYRASHDDYEKSVLPSGYPAGTPQEALDCACGLYLGDTTAWLDQPPRRINGRDHYMPQLVSFAASHGYAVFFITGRPQSQTDATITNLTNAGYAAPQSGHLFLKPPTPPSYLHCANPSSCTTIEYKSGTRRHISSLGYSIMADFGDQYSDLLGGDAGHQVKIPNPMYYIP